MNNYTTALHEARHAVTAYHLKCDIEYITPGHAGMQYNARTQIFRPRWYRNAMNTWLWKRLSPALQARCLRSHGQRLITIGYAAFIGRSPHEPRGNFRNDLRAIRNHLESFYPQWVPVRRVRMLRLCRLTAKTIISQDRNRRAIELFGAQLEPYISGGQRLDGREAMLMISSALVNSAQGA